MKQRIWIGMALGLSFLLSGCELLFQAAGPGFGFDREGYLKSIKPRLEYWEKPGMTAEGRWADSMECGAGRNSAAMPAPVSIKAAQRDDETYEQTEDRLYLEWHQCMEVKGYEDVCFRKVATPKD